MEKFTIVEARPAVYYFTYEVEAESQSEALEKVFDGIEPIDTDVVVDYSDNGEYEFR